MNFPSVVHYYIEIQKQANLTEKRSSLARFQSVLLLLWSGESVCAGAQDATSHREENE